MGIKVHEDDVEPTNSQSAGSFHEMEVNVDLMIQLKEKFGIL